jgi:hypothetical protein
MLKQKLEEWGERRTQLQAIRFNPDVICSIHNISSIAQTILESKGFPNAILATLSLLITPLHGIKFYLNEIIQTYLNF